MREKCSHADRYKANRQPRCGCTSCADKWTKAAVDRWLFTARSADDHLMLTTLLYRVCGGSGERFEEATGYLEAAFAAGVAHGKESK